MPSAYLGSMKKVLFIILISCFSLTIISCSDDKEEYSASGTTDTTTTTSRWTTLADMSTGREGHASVFLDDKLYVIGGRITAP